MALLINNERIDDSVLAAEFASVKSYFERLGNVSCCERDEEFRGYARQNVISRVLLMQEALAKVEAPSREDLDTALEKLKSEHGGEARFLAAIGATSDQIDLVRQDVEMNLRLETLIERLCAEDPEPLEEELRRFYDQHIDIFMTPEEVRASHISKAPPRGEQRGAVYEQFREVRQRLLAGADFDDLARQHSDRGHELIDLGFFKRGELPEEFELVAFSMNVGEISPVFASMAGFHIIKVTDRKAAAARPFEEVRQEAREHYLTERRQQRVRLLVEELQRKATIEDVDERPEEEPSEVQAG